MKKIIFIILGVILLGAVGWVFLFPSQSAPVINQVQDYLPFGSGDNLPPPDDTDGGAFGEFSEGDNSPVDARSKLFQISKEPIAGSAIISSTSTVFVRYVERATGHIYDFDLYTLEKTRVTNQTIPKIYEAVFNSTGNKVVYRTLEEDGQTGENVSISLTPPKNTASTTQEFYTINSTILRRDTDELMVGSNNTLYYILKNDSSIVSSNFEGGILKTLYTSPFNNWRIETPGNKLILWTKPSLSADGYAYDFNVTNSSFSKIIGPTKGLTISISPSGNDLIYSLNDSGKTRTYLSKIPIFETFEIFPVTLAEKCAWSNKTENKAFCGVPINALSPREPDDWYKGVSHYTDNIWSFSGGTEESILLSEPKKIFGTDLDIMNPNMAPNDDFLIFTNKKDLSLWAFRIE